MRASKVRLYYRLQIAAHEMRRTADRTLLEASGVTAAQAAVLALVGSGDHVTQRDIATALHLNESAVTAMVARLLKLGFLVRTVSEKDGRAWSLSLTPVGEKARFAAHKAIVAINRRISEALRDEEIDQLAGLLNRLTEAFVRA